MTKINELCSGCVLERVCHESTRRPSAFTVTGGISHGIVACISPLLHVLGCVYRIGRVLLIPVKVRRGSRGSHVTDVHRMNDLALVDHVIILPEIRNLESW